VSTLRALRWLVIGLAMPGVVHAGRPLSTDDATILGPKDCQLETWVDRSRVATDFWAAPACNFGGNFEWQVGASRTHAEGQGALSQTYVQGKTAFVSVDDNPWGVGLTAGVQRFPLRETESGWSNPYVLVPVSFQLGTADRLLHLNVGWLRNSEEKRDITLWGIAFEAPISGIPFTVVGEVFGENASRPFYRLGGRWTQVARNLDVDLTYVARSGGTKSEKILSLGLYYKFDQAIP
jgi:hypothetical protein